MSHYIDTHSHLDLLKDIQINLANEDALPIKTISVTNAPFIYEPSRNLFHDAKNIRVALGMHPELIEQYASQLNMFEKLIDDTQYIGEIGLDGSPRFAKSFEYQKKVFIEILKLCQKNDRKVITIHSRNAATETVDLVKKYLEKSDCRVIFHWYSGSAIDLKVGIKYGYYFSVNHKMIGTEKGKQIIMSIPNNLLLTETDAPFTFDEMINSRLESLNFTIKGISILKNQKPDIIKEMIYRNFKTLLQPIHSV